MSDAAFYADFCLPADDISEFWRSGGATGRPLFYPRNARDMHHAMSGFARLFDCLGIAPGSRAYGNYRIAYALRFGADQFIFAEQANTHGIDQGIPFIRRVEHHLAGHRRNADTVAVVTNPLHHTRHQPAYACAVE